MAKPNMIKPDMIKPDMITIAFPNGGILSASVTGEKADRRVAPHSGVEVPRRYGEHLISDRFAYEVKPHKTAAKSAITECETALFALREQAAKATDDAETAKLAAEIGAVEKMLAELK